MPTTTDTISGAIRAETARAGLSLRELARRLGVSHTWVTHRANGRTKCTVDDLSRIADELGIPLATLLTSPDANGSAA